MKSIQEINWSDPGAKISRFFNVGEAVWLRSWGRLATEQDGLTEAVKLNLVRFFTLKMDPIRELLGLPVYVKSAYRPQVYNVAIGGARKSAHMYLDGFGAVDFWLDADGNGELTGRDCDSLKQFLLPKAEELGIRIEDNGSGARWVHVDDRPVPPWGKRFFKP